MTQGSIPRLSNDHSRAELTDALDEFGCCVIEAAAPGIVMDEIASDLAPYAATSDRGDTAFAGAGTRRTGLVPNRSPAYRKIAMHRSIMAAGDHVLRDAPCWILSSVGFFELFRGEPKQLLHRDIWKYGVEGLPHEVDLNGIWAITDFTAENGATHVIPGSHQWPDERKASDDSSIPVEMGKGSLLLYQGKTFHGGGENVSDQPRIGLSVQHSAGWLAQTESLMVECPPSEIVDWPDDLIRFIGYQPRGPAIGKYGDHEDPFVLIEKARAGSRAEPETPVS